MSINWIQVGVEALMIICGLLALYWKQNVDNEHRFTKLETLVAGLSEDHKELKGEITNMHGRISGISKALAELKGRLQK